MDKPGRCKEEGDGGHVQAAGSIEHECSTRFAAAFFRHRRPGMFHSPCLTCKEGESPKLVHDRAPGSPDTVCALCPLKPKRIVCGFPVYYNWYEGRSTYGLTYSVPVRRAAGPVELYNPSASHLKLVGYL